jgi:hypothetical protein
MFTINFVCVCATSPIAASIRHWLKHTGLSSFLQSADTLRYQRVPAHWHGLTSKYLPTKHENLISRPNQQSLPGGGRGGETKTQKTRTANTFLNMQWCLWNTGCQLDAYMLQTPTTLQHTKPRLIRSGFAILSDSASDPYWARSNGGTRNDHLL